MIFLIANFFNERERRKIKNCLCLNKSEEGSKKIRREFLLSCKKGGKIKDKPKYFDP